MAFRSVGQELSPYPQNNPTLHSASTGGSTVELTIEYHQRQPASVHGDEASRPLHFDYALPVVTALPFCVQVGPQYNFPPYQTQPLAVGEPAIAQDTRGRCKCNKRAAVAVKPHVCGICNKKCRRIQELKRHMSDVHLPRNKCPFCDYFPWSRPDKIKHHIKSDHDDIFTAELRGKFETLCGQKLVEFLIRYAYGLEVVTTPNITSLDVLEFSYLS